MKTWKITFKKKVNYYADDLKDSSLKIKKTNVNMILKAAPIMDPHFV